MKNSSNYFPSLQPLQVKSEYLHAATYSELETPTPFPKVFTPQKQMAYQQVIFQKAQAFQGAISSCSGIIFAFSFLIIIFPPKFAIIQG